MSITLLFNKIKSGTFHPFIWFFFGFIFNMKEKDLGEQNLITSIILSTTINEFFLVKIQWMESFYLLLLN